MWMDTHCHLTLSPLAQGVPEILHRAQKQKVEKFLTISCEVEEFASLKRLMDQWDCVYGSVGVHPHEAQKTLELYSPQELLECLHAQSSHPKILGLGETGLDFYYTHSPKALQTQVFQIHLEAAHLTNLPVLIHTRSAEEETIEQLKAHKGTLQGLIHCFSGTSWLAHQALDLGFYISLSGIITFPKASDLRDTVKKLPLDRLLLETDAPYLAPVPHRGKPNEPAFLVHTAQVIADLKGVSLQTLAQQMEINAQTLFKRLH